MPTATPKSKRKQSTAPSRVESTPRNSPPSPWPHERHHNHNRKVDAHPQHQHNTSRCVRTHARTHQTKLAYHNHRRRRSRRRHRFHAFTSTSATAAVVVLRPSSFVVVLRRRSSSSSFVVRRRRRPSSSSFVVVVVVIVAVAVVVVAEAWIRSASAHGTLNSPPPSNFTIHRLPLHHPTKNPYMLCTPLTTASVHRLIVAFLHCRVACMYDLSQCTPMRTEHRAHAGP